MDRATLIDRVAQGEAFKFVFFWSHEPTHAVGRQCFSQWYPAAFELDGVHYPTSEHAMMAAKANLFEDHETLSAIIRARSPGEAKALGRSVRGYVDERWAKARFDAVVRANIAKFSQNEALADYLRTTGNRVLVEASPRDRVWGNGLGADDPNAIHPDRWPGTNLLGFALMQVRDAL